MTKAEAADILLKDLKDSQLPDVCWYWEGRALQAHPEQGWDDNQRNPAPYKLRG